jgi:hypothetical protein
MRQWRGDVAHCSALHYGVSINGFVVFFEAWFYVLILCLVYYRYKLQMNKSSNGLHYLRYHCFSIPFMFALP